MASKRQKREKKIKQAIVAHRVGHVWCIDGEFCATRFVNQGNAFCSPVFDDTSKGRYRLCADRKLDAWGRDSKGKIALFFNDGADGYPIDPPGTDQWAVPPQICGAV